MTSVHSSTLARSRKRWLVTSVALATTAAVLTVGGVASAAHAPVGLGTADSFAVLAGQTVTNTGPSVIDGDLGLSPGSAVDGFPPGEVIGGVQHVSDAVALQAQSDLTTAYIDAAGRPATASVPPVDYTELSGLTLKDGTFKTAGPMGLTGTVTLDAENNPDAVFIFQAGSTLITASNSTVALTNGADPCNVFWQVGSSATLGTDTTFVGTVMALTSITLDNGTDVEGRVLARNGSVTLDSNNITAPDCDEPTTTTTSAPPSSGSTTPAATETSVPTTPTTTVTNGLPIPIPIPIPILPPGDDTPGGPDQPPVDGSQPPSGPGQPPVDGGQPPVAEGQPPVAVGQPPTGGEYIVPKGYPDTGAGGTAAASSPLKANGLVAALVALTLIGSGIAAGQAFRLNRRLR